jgi:pyruvate,water dikinase
MRDLLPLEEITPEDGEAVGGKALGLALLIRAGLPVPRGFCLTTAAFRRCHRHPLSSDPSLAQAIIDSYRCLGAGPVAVRSSTAAEDSAGASFAGQHATVLGVASEAALLDAVTCCWGSLNSERATAYRQGVGQPEQEQAMAVIVQALVPAEVAGVLFTRDPLDAEGRRILVEAAWGLGESVVSGRVTPDRFHLDRQTGVVLDRHIACKQTRVTPAGPEPVPLANQQEACLDDARLAELAGLGRVVEAVFGDARDIEWAWAAGRFWLLQARPVTVGTAAEREQVRREEIAALGKGARPEGTVWVRRDLAEGLPQPTPMTWSVIRHLLAGKGGFGLMYRDLGFEPDPILDREGAYDLICGRPYCNLSREPLFYSLGVPLAHDFAALKRAPEQAVASRPRPNLAGVGWRGWLGLPRFLFRSSRAALRLRRLTRSFESSFRRDILPAFLEETRCEAATDWSSLDATLLRQRLEFWIRRTLIEFARDALKPGVLAAQAVDRLERVVLRALGPEQGRTAVQQLLVNLHPTGEADLARATDELVSGHLDRATFLRQFGNRAWQEMELAQPRWGEAPDWIERMMGLHEAPPQSPLRSPLPPAGGEGLGVRGPASAESQRPHPRPLSRGERGEQATATAISGLNSRLQALIQQELTTVRTYLSLRETARHHWMDGYALIRRVLVELDRRYRLGGGIFFLTLEELPRLAAGEDLTGLIRQRRRRRAFALSLEVPPVLFSDDLEAIGRPFPSPSSPQLQGTPLSPGVVEGPALVRDEPATGSLPREPFILVCPATDPAWVPLLPRALGLVMETGGILSHGAIVAREFGLPAVAGLPGIHRIVRTGQRLRLDGTAGTVHILDPDA